MLFVKIVVYFGISFSDFASSSDLVNPKLIEEWLGGDLFLTVRIIDNLRLF